MAYINVDEVYILDNTGLQVDMATDIPFVDAGFTDAQKEQARKNIAAGGTNPNLLDNWWFGNPVNQRGLTSYSGTGQLKTIDRWILFNGSGVNSLSVQSGYISVKSDSNGFGQFVENSVGAALNGKTVTCSVLFNDGSITSATGIYSNSSLVSLGNGFYIGINGGKQTIVSYLTGTTAKDIKAMKVELGTISTLANDVPPDYGTELLKCQRYFLRMNYTSVAEPIGYGYAYAASQARILIPTPVTMRADPTISASATGNLRINSNGTYLTPSGFTSTGTVFPHGVSIHFGISGATSGAIAILFSYDTNYIDFSADL